MRVSLTQLAWTDITGELGAAAGATVLCQNVTNTDRLTAPALITFADTNPGPSDLDRGFLLYSQSEAFDFVPSGVERVYGRAYTGNDVELEASAEVAS